jgi:hypothetical protein
MSSFTGTLEIDSKKYEVVNFNYSVNRDLDFQGRPTSRLKNSILTIEVVVPEGDILFFQWLIRNEIKTGTVHFDKIDQESKFNGIKFEDAFCVYYSHSFSNTSANAMTMEVKVSPSKVTVTSGSSEATNEFFTNV